VPRSVVLRPRRTDRRRGPARTPPPPPPPARDFRTGRRGMRSGVPISESDEFLSRTMKAPSDVAGGGGVPPDAGRGGSAACGASSHRRIRCPRLDRWPSGAFLIGARTGFDRLGRRARRGRWSTGGLRTATATATATAGSSSTAAPTRPVLGRGGGSRRGWWGDGGGERLLIPDWVGGRGGGRGGLAFGLPRDLRRYCTRNFTTDRLRNSRDHSRPIYLIYV
jgi:hypothetical protein